MRQRRLMADANRMRRFFSGNGPIRIARVNGDPPDFYVVEFFVQGLETGPNGKPIPRDHHRAEIQLTCEYPRQKPLCRMLTPCFHPNIDLTTICIGDHWTAGERLADLAIRIAELITFQAYNIKSPLNGEAAMWADLNRQSLPLDNRDLHLLAQGA